MTTPITARPAVHVTETVSGNGMLGDLWSVSVTESSDRLVEGVQVWPGHGGAHGLWPLPCVGEPDPDASKDGSRAGSTWFPPVIVWAADECSTVGNSVEHANQMARATLDHDARYRLEEHYMSYVLAMPGTPVEGVPTGHLETVTPAEVDGVPPLVMALGAVEARMRRWGHTGMVHASAEVLPALARLSQVVDIDGGLYTRSGNKWVFGSGYTSLGVDTLIGTGPTSIWMQTVPPVAELDPQRNNIYGLHEYIAVVTHFDHAVRAVAA